MTSPEIERITALSREVVGLRERQQPRQALAPALACLDLVRRHLGEATPSYATALNNVAAVRRDLGEWTAAEAAYLSSLDLRLRLLDGDHPDVAYSLGNLAGLYLEMNDPGRAEPLARRALAIWRRILPRGHPDLERPLGGLAITLKRMGRFAAAKPLLEEVLESTERRAAADPELAGAALELARVHARLGELDRAASLFERALAAYRRTFGDRHPSVALCLNEVAEVHRQRGDLARAEPLYREVLSYLSATVGERDVNFAVTLNNLGALRYAAGGWDEAEQLYGRALEIWKALADASRPEHAATLNNLAELYRAMGLYEAALPLCRRALDMRRALLGEQHPDCAASLNNLAELLRHLGEHESAAPLYQRALAIWRHTLGESHAELSRGVNNLSLIFRASGDWEGAERLAEEALDLKRRTLGERHPETAMALGNLAEVYAARGDLGAAEPLVRQALESLEGALGSFHPNVARALENLAVLRTAAGDPASAMELLRRAARIDDETLAQVFGTVSEAQRAAHLREIHGRLQALLSLVVRYLGEEPAAMGVAADLVLRRKGIGLEALAVQRDAILGGHRPELMPLLAELRELRGRAAALVLSGGAGLGSEELTAASHRREEIERELARRAPEVRLEEMMRTVTRHNVAAALPQGSVLIEWVACELFDFGARPALGEPRTAPARYLALVLPATDPSRVTLVDTGAVAEVDAAVARFRRVVTQPARHGLLEAGSALRQALIDPLASSLRGRRRLFIAPDGDLNRLPFETLPDRRGTLLVEEFRLSYLASGRDALRFALPPAPSAKPLVIADPAFDLRPRDRLRRTVSRLATSLRRSWAGSPPTAVEHGAVPPSAGSPARPKSHRGAPHFAPLPGSRIEGDCIERRTGARLWTGAAALEGRLKSVRSPRILHIATHGFFLADPAQALRESGLGLENPLLRSGLALAGANTWAKGGELPEDAEDGILTAEDVTGLDLSATALVVLSACETGLGEVQTGEGVFGLRRAFALAGARTLVMSLWKIPDLVTAILMDRFYEELCEREAPRDEALRNAQLHVRQLTAGEIEGWLAERRATSVEHGREWRRWPRHEAAGAPFAHPFFWGGFILQGDFRPFGLPAAPP